MRIISKYLALLWLLAAICPANSQTNNPEAQYSIWSRERDRALDELKRLDIYVPHEERKAAREKWKNAPDSELAAAAAKTNLAAQVILAERQWVAEQTNAAKAFISLDKSAEQGFAPAQYEAAFYYLHMGGWNPVDINQAKGLDFLRRAADQGWPKAQQFLASIFLQGELCPPDIPQAVALYQKAADQNLAKSQYALAMLYANGYGVPRHEHDTPLALLRKSAAQNYVPAVHELGERYRIGLGVPMDLIEAARYYNQAWFQSQNQGTDQEAGRVINDFLSGEHPYIPNPSLPRDLKPFARVAAVYLNAVRNLDSAAMVQVANWYQEGHFAFKDNVKALQWLTLAASLGSADASKQADNLKTTLTPEQLKQAQQHVLDAILDTPSDRRHR
jgi:TPR repeat protein